MARRTQQQRREATQTKLLDATIACIVELGYAATSTTEICARAGVSRGAQVHHYPTKATLVAAAVEHLFAQRHHELVAVHEQHGDLSPAFDHLWRIYSGPTLHAWMELVVAARTDPELRRSVAAVNRRFVAATLPTFVRMFGVSEDQARVGLRLTFAVLDGLAMNAILQRDDALAKAVLTALRQTLAGWSTAP